MHADVEIQTSTENAGNMPAGQAALEGREAFQVKDPSADLESEKISKVARKGRAKGLGKCLVYNVDQRCQGND